MKHFTIFTFVVCSTLNLTALAQDARISYADSSIGVRVRSDHNNKGEITRNQVQYNVDLKLQLQLDEDGKWKVITRAKTGAAFESSSNNAGIGNNTKFDQDFHARQFFVQYESASHSASVGFLPILPSSVAKGTFSFDSDGWIDGARLETTQLGKWAKRASISVGRIDDLKTPSIFDREIDSPNVIMVHVQGNLSERISYMAEGTLINSSTTSDEQYLRMMIDIATKDTLGFIDKIVVEPLIQNTEHPLQGFAISANKAIGDSWSVTGQYSYKGEELSAQEKTYAPREDFYLQGHQFTLKTVKKIKPQKIFKAKHAIEWSLDLRKTISAENKNGSDYIGFNNTKGLGIISQLKIKF